MSAPTPIHKPVPILGSVLLSNSVSAVEDPLNKRATLVGISHLKSENIPPSAKANTIKKSPTPKAHTKSYQKLDEMIITLHICNVQGLQELCAREFNRLKGFYHMFPSIGEQKMEELYTAMEETLKPYEACYNKIDITIPTLCELYLLISEIEKLSLEHSHPFLKNLLPLCKSALQNHLKAKAEFFKKSLEDHAWELINATLGTRRECANRLLIAKNSEIDLPLQKEDLKKWENLSSLREEVLKIREVYSTSSLDYLLYLLFQPFSFKDLPSSPKVPPYNEIQFVVNQILNIPKEKPKYPPLLPYTWQYRESIGKGGSKEVLKVTKIGKEHIRALGVSRFTPSQEGLASLFKAQKEASLLMRLKGKAGCVQFHAVTYRSLPINQGKMQIQQGILMRHYTGDGIALLAFLKSAEGAKYNTPKHWLSIFKSLATGLHTIHTELNVIHQDIKPANILYEIDAKDQTLFPEGTIRAVISDLGSAAPRGTSSQATTLIFNPLEVLNAEIEYTKQKINKNTPSPSLFKDVITEKLDIYMLGLIGHLLFKGYNENHLGTKSDYSHMPPLTGQGSVYYSNKLKLLENHLLPSCGYELLSEAKENPSTIEHLIWRMCHNDPSVRPNSAAEVLSLIDQINL